jgi:hypothetical protein
MPESGRCRFDGCHPYFAERHLFYHDIADLTSTFSIDIVQCLGFLQILFRIAFLF